MSSAKQKSGKNATSEKVPSHWSSMPSKEQYRRVSLAVTSSEYKEMETLFKKTIRKTVVIKSIERVQNPFMWEKYQRYFSLTTILKQQSINQSINQSIRVISFTLDD